MNIFNERGETYTTRPVTVCAFQYDGSKAMAERLEEEFPEWFDFRDDRLRISEDEGTAVVTGGDWLVNDRGHIRLVRVCDFSHKYQVTSPVT